MADKIKGITIEFRGDTTPLQKAIRTVNTEISRTTKELTSVNKALKFNPTSVELWRQKQELLEQKIKSTTDKLSALKQQQQQMDAAGVEKNSEEYRRLERQIIETESQLKTFKAQLREVGNVKLKALSESFKETGSKLESVGRSMRGISLAAAGVASGIGAISVKAGRAADDLNTLSKVTGIGTADLQKYSYTADLVDVSVEAIAKSNKRLVKSAYSAANGSKASAAAFEAIGVSVTDANGKLRNSDAIFTDVISALGQMTNETERDAIAQQLMGRSAAELNPLIEDGGETYKRVAETMSKYGLDFIDQETLDKANEFNDELDTIKLLGSVAFAQIGTELAAHLAPALEKAVDLVGKFANWLSGLDPEVLTIIGSIAAVVAVLAPLLIGLGKVAFAISSIMNVASLLGGVLGGVAAGPILAVIAAIGLLIAAGVLLYKHWDEIKAFAIETWEGIKNTVVTVWTSIKTFLTNVWSGIKALAAILWEGIKMAALGPMYTLARLLQNNWQAIKSAASSAWASIKSAITNPIEQAKNAVQGIINRIKSLFPINLGRIMNLSLPHISIGSKSRTIMGKTISVPDFDVDWYAQGGIFDSPQVIGVGEGTSAEAVVPLDKFWTELRNSNSRTDELLAQQISILMLLLEEMQKEKNFKVDDIWAGRYINSKVR